MGSLEAQCVRDRFIIVRQLGGGGMGVVYEAIDRSSGHHVALKTMRAATGDGLLRFKQEFRSLQDIHHPNLVSLGELVEEAGQWWFSMELVRGRNLLSYVRQAAIVLGSPSGPADLAGALAPTDPQIENALAENAGPASGPLAETAKSATPRVEEQTLDVARLRRALEQLVEGVHAIHLAHKVHRDIKPDNILVTAEGRVVILDFGLIGESLALDSGILGTIA